MKSPGNREPFIEKTPSPADDQTRRLAPSNGSRFAPAPAPHPPAQCDFVVLLILADQVEVKRGQIHYGFLNAEDVT